ATAFGGSFVDGLAAVLPCYWIYARVGLELMDRGSTDPRYRRWIDSYSGEDFTKSCAEVLALTDRIGPTLTPADEAEARRHFVATSRYEWMFWDSAYRRESWPVLPVGEGSYAPLRYSARHARRANLPLVVRGIAPAGRNRMSDTGKPCRRVTASRIASSAGRGSARAVPAARSAITTSRSSGSTVNAAT